LRRAILIIGIVLALAAIWVAVKDWSTHRLTLRAYFQHVQDAKQGMSVCVDGVTVGSVKSVTVHPELGDRPVEVILKISTPYELRIPQGSTAQVTEAGILRPIIVDIDTHSATGPPIANGGTIEGRESTDDQAAHAIGVAVKAIIDESKESQQEKKNEPVRK
jgi:ABC-type transporter Mla subunit MlaD